MVTVTVMVDYNGCQERNVGQQNSELHFGRKCQDQSAMLAEVTVWETGNVGQAFPTSVSGVQRWLHLGQV